MSKHHHQSKAEQIQNKANGAASFQDEKMFYQASELRESKDIRMMAAVHDSSVQLRAYQIFQEKGGSELENWLEAERTLMNNDQAIPSFINEGNPNIQK